MNIVVLAGGLSTERDVSFKTGSMVAKALKENGHKVILLDVFMGYSDREEDLTGIFDRADEISVQVSDIPTEDQCHSRNPENTVLYNDTSSGHKQLPHVQLLE